MKRSTAEVISSSEHGRKRLIKYNGRYYTAFGRLFVVPGNCLDTPWEQFCSLPRYQFMDWNTLTGMYREDQ